VSSLTVIVLSRTLVYRAACGTLIASASFLPLIAEAQHPATRGSVPRRPAAVEELLFVSNEGSRNITVLRASNLSVLATIPVDARPRGIQASRNGKRIYVALSDDRPGQQGDGDAIVGIDVATRKVVARYPSGTDPEQFALLPGDTRLYASNEDAGTVSAIDLRNGTVSSTLVVGIEPEGVAASPDGRWVYVTAETSNSVSVVDTRTNKVVANLLVDIRPRAAAFAPNGLTAWVTSEISGSVCAVNGRTHELVECIEMENGAGKPVGVVISPDSRRLYVANGGTHAVVVLDATTRRVTARIPVGRRPWGIAIARDGSRIYVANGLSNSVSAIDTKTLKVVGTAQVGERPWGIAVVKH
jgi:PQQ-dependent catabolism-associated beta-propeller protein